MDNKPLRVSVDSQQRLVQYINRCVVGSRQGNNMRFRMQHIDRLYQREVDFTTNQRRFQQAAQNGDASKIQDVVIPVVMPQVETALDTLRDIFLSSYPIFPVIAKPEMQDAALQMETTIGEQARRFGWSAEILNAIRDGLKYNLLAVEVDWSKVQTWTVTNGGPSVTQGQSVQTIYEGNSLRRLDPYNLILDRRVAPSEQHTKGEAVGYTEIISAVELKRRFAELDPTLSMNYAEAINSGSASYTSSLNGGEYFIPQVNPQALLDATVPGRDNWDAWVGLQDSNAPLQYASAYEWTCLYARIIPSVFKLGGGAQNTATIYKLILINQKVCVLVQRMTNAHNYLPIVVSQATEAGLGWQDKSVADNAAAFQYAATGVFKSAMESQRRKVYDRIFYDASRINKSDMDNTDSVARIPVKTEAYQQPVTNAFAVAPYRDDGVAQMFSVVQMLTEQADVANGQNRVQRGQFQKGNKTREEFQQTMNNSDSRPRMVALTLEARFFTPIKEIIKQNILQYQPPVTLYNQKTSQPVKIDPVKLREIAIEFKIADGLMPTSQLMNFETFQALLNAAGQNPMLAQSYDVVGAFFYFLKLQGASWLDDFKIQQPTQNATTQPNPGSAVGPAGTPSN